MKQANYQQVTAGFKIQQALNPAQQTIEKQLPSRLTVSVQAISKTKQDLVKASLSGRLLGILASITLVEIAAHAASTSPVNSSLVSTIAVLIGTAVGTVAGGLISLLSGTNPGLGRNDYKLDLSVSRDISRMAVVEPTM